MVSFALRGKTPDTNQRGQVPFLGATSPNNLVQTVDPLGRIVQDGYDADNRLTSEKWLPAGGGSDTHTPTPTFWSPDSSSRHTVISFAITTPTARTRAGPTTTTLTRAVVHRTTASTPHQA